MHNKTHSEELSDIFGIKLTEEDIITHLAFEKMLAPKKANVVLVEGGIDKKIYEKLFKREEKENFFFINARGKENVLAYIRFDNSTNIFGIVDRDFEENTIPKNVLTTHYSCIEADLLDVSSLNEAIETYELEEVKEHLFILEELMIDVYKGEISQVKIKNSINYKVEWLTFKTKAKFIKNKLFKNMGNTDHQRQCLGKGVHCAKYLLLIIKLLQYNGKSKDDFHNEILSSLPMSNPLIQNIVNSEIFNNSVGKSQ